MEAEGIPLNAGVYVLLVDMYVGIGDLEKAVSTLKDLMAREPDTKLTPYKYLRLALLMAQKGNTEGEVRERERKITLHYTKSNYVVS